MEDAFRLVLGSIKLPEYHPASKDWNPN
jgi:hypothetical protein